MTHVTCHCSLRESRVKDEDLIEIGNRLFELAASRRANELAARAAQKEYDNSKEMKQLQ